jgi:hypothetical protein
MFRVALVVPALVIAIGIGGCAVGDPRPATQVSDTEATLNADIYSSRTGDTTYFWRYGETTAYGSETSHERVSIFDDQPHPVAKRIGALTPGTTYHTQVCAQDEEAPARLVCSGDRTFQTQLLDRVNGNATRGTASWSIDAWSGPSGENASGNVGFFDMVAGRFGQGTVGCLKVRGNTAVVGYTGQEFTGAGPGPRVTVYARIVDSGTPHEDTVDYQQGELTDSPDCDLYEPSETAFTGDFTVTDAQAPN